MGVRLVTSQEMPEGKQFDETLLKEMTGGDRLTARYLYREYFSFYPVLKLMISGNHTPIITGMTMEFGGESTWCHSTRSLKIPILN